MSVADTYEVKRYVGNDSASSFSIPWPFVADADIVAIQIDDASAVSTTLTLDSDYTLTGAGSESGGTLTLSDGALASGQTLVIYRDEAAEQTRDFVNGVAPSMTEVEAALDKLTRQVQQLEERINRAVLYSVTENINGKTFPSPSEGAFIVWNSSGGFDNSDAVDMSTLGASTGYERFVATDAQTLFTLTEFTYVTGANNLVVYRNGKLVDSADLAETSSSSFTLSACIEGDVIEARSVTMDAAADISSAATVAQAAETAALASEVAAAASALAAATSASDAATSESNASTSESNAANSATAAEAAKVAAEAAAATATAPTDAKVDSRLKYHGLI